MNSKLAVDMSCSGANYSDPDTETIVIVQSSPDGLISLPSDDAEFSSVIQNDVACVGTEAVIDQTSFDISHSSVPEAVDSDVDLTAMSVNPVETATDSLPLRVCWSQSEKQNVYVCKFIHNGSRFPILIFL